MCRFTLFAQRKPNVNQDWQRKLPDFVKRLEEALYRAAHNKVSQRRLLPGPAFPHIASLDYPARTAGARRGRPGACGPALNVSYVQSCGAIGLRPPVLGSQRELGCRVMPARRADRAFDALVRRLHAFQNLFRTV